MEGRTAMSALCFSGAAMTVMSQPVAAPASVELEVERIRRLLKERRFPQAVSAAAALRTLYPENRDVLYLLALGQRQSRQIKDALDTLADMERHHPGASQLYQERGHCYVAVKDAPRAIEAYGRAVQINPALPAAWSMLEGLYKMVGDEEHRRVAAAHANKLKSMPPEVITATGLFCEGELAASERLIRAFLLRHGDHVEAMRLLARIGVARDILDDAEVLLAPALDMAPDYIELRRDYACVLIDRHKHAEAIAQLDGLLKLDPKNVDYRTLRATATVGFGDHEGGVRGFSDVLADTSPQSSLAADRHWSIAHSLKTLGRRAESIDEYKKAIEVRPNFGDTYWSLANLKTDQFSAEEIARLEAAEADPSTALIDRYHLCFALGKAYEDRRVYEVSFRYYERGNALKRAESRYRPELLEQNTANQKRICTREFFRERNGYGAPSREPILILGLPRAGSTLLEQILASHSQVEGTQELANVPRVVLDLQGYDPDLDNPRYPACLEAMTADEFRTLGEKYLADTRIYRSRTPSSEQVRQPIFREGLDQWRHYEPWLGPLKEALGDALSRYRERRHEPETGSRRSVPVR